MNTVEKIISEQICKAKKDVIDGKLDPIIFAIQLIHLYEQLKELNGLSIYEYERFLKSTQ